MYKGGHRGNFVGEWIRGQTGRPANRYVGGEVERWRGMDVEGERTKEKRAKAKIRKGFVNSETFTLTSPTQF